MKVALTGNAQRDVRRAQSHYSRISPTLGRRFVDAVNVVIGDVSETPRRFSKFGTDPEIRRAMTKRFPYKVFFRIDADRIVVIRVVHTARSDRMWRRSIYDQP